mgnify:CR=1 FL=1
MQQKLEVPARRHLLRPIRKHKYRLGTARDRPAVIIQNDVGNTYAPTLIVVPLTSNTEKESNSADTLLIGKRRAVYVLYGSGRTDLHHRQKPHFEILRASRPGRYAAARLCLEEQSCLEPTGQHSEAQAHHPLHAAYAPPEVVDGKPPVYPYTPIQSSFEDAGSVEEMMLYTELQSAVHAMIQRLEYSFTFNPSLLTSPKRKQQVTEILEEAEKYIWRIKEEMRCA